MGDTYENFRKQLDPMRYIDHMGEVAEYMMVLSLNELGRSFLAIDDYLSSSQPYVAARPEEKQNGGTRDKED